MSNLHEALASGDPQDYTALMSLALNVAEWCEQNGTPDTHGWFDDPAYPGDYVDAGTFYLVAYSFWERAAEARRVGPLHPAPPERLVARERPRLPLAWRLARRGLLRQGPPVGGGKGNTDGN